jgi:exopolyphosphatase / guanosine-5'-triphosphate,3'-diphosphate pyrophosphatase
VEAVTTPIFGAIDAGSNAIRVLIGRQDGGELQRIEADRVAVRLGHGAFTRGELDGPTIDEAVQAFQRFRERFDHHGVTAYRAVATSAVRDASNRDVLLHRVYHEAGIELDVIDGHEEARLVRKAVTAAYSNGQQASPRCILDLGGGSLEVNINAGTGWNSASLPVGTVRLLETFGIGEILSDADAAMVRRNTVALLQSIVAGLPANESLTTAAIIGGNAEALAKLLMEANPASPTASLQSFELVHLERALPDILHANVATRMSKWNLRRDRAEVLAIAALVFATAARQLGILRFLVPGVGVREAVLLELAESVRSRTESADTAVDKAILTSARAFANRVDHDTTHGEHVRRLARSLFVQMRDVHQLDNKMCMLLELAALLHDIGEVVSPRGHHKHSEYMIRWGRLPGLGDADREMVALAVRCHRKSAADCKKFISESALNKDQKQQTRRIAALLRVADGLDTGHRRRVQDFIATRMGEGVVLDLTVRDGPTREDAQLTRKSDLFKDEFGLELRVTVTRAAVN